MINIIDQRQGNNKPVSVPGTKVNVTIINNNVIKVNGKYVIRTYLNDWIRQEGVWPVDEIDAAKHIIKQLNAQRK